MKIKKVKIEKHLIPFLFLLVSILYLTGLSISPIYINQDELGNGLNALSIARTLRDTNGRFLPWYFQHLNSFWLPPLVVYPASLFLKFLPVSEFSFRISTAVIGLANVFLLGYLVFLLTKSKKLAIIGSLILALTPAHFIQSRLLLGNIYPISYVLLWLIFIKKYFDKGKMKHLFLSSLFLGIGIHSYHASKIYMPLYFGITIVLGLVKKKINEKQILVALFGFLIPIILFLPWFRNYPEAFFSQVEYISTKDETINSNNGYLSVVDPKRFKDIVTNYISYFSAEILFTKGDASLIHSTQKTGVFLFPMVFLIVFGVLEIIKEKDLTSELILISSLIYPAAPSIINEASRISRGLVVIPFGVLLATYGVKFIFNSKEKLLKYLLLPILFLSVIQFSFFLIDYYGNYKVESASMFNGNITGALEATIKGARLRNTDKIYIDNNINFSNLYFDFAKNKYEFVSDNDPIFFDALKQDFSEFSKGSVIVIKAGNAQKLGSGLEKIETIREPNGNESFYVYYKN